MKYLCNHCSKVIQEHDVIIHYTKGSDGLEIVAICQLCLDEYLEKTKVNADRKADNAERMKMKRKW
jgi:predicted RNA-binding protein with PUA-like domain